MQERCCYSRQLKLQTDFIEFLWDQKTHLQGTGASTSLKSSAHLLYAHCGEKISTPFVRPRFSSTFNLLSELLLAGLKIVFALLGPVFLIFFTHKFPTIYAEAWMQILNSWACFFLKGTLQEYSHVLQLFDQELCRERKKPKT